jgi:lactate dehydrogenase-like 2-hydroxyacid dehydrogenase
LEPFEILMPAPLMPIVFDSLSKSFTVHKLWEAVDQEALIANIKDRVRGMATGYRSPYPIDGDFISRFPKVEIISHMGVGYDIVDAKWANQHGIIVTNTPDVLNDEVADLAMGLLLATVRQLPQAHNYLRAGKWLEKPYPLTATLRERTMGILGLGRIGKAIAKRAEAFGVKIAYHGRSKQPDVPCAYYPTLIELAVATDILMVIAPGGADTRHIVNKQVLEALGPNGILINVARGSLVDEDALVAALREGKLLSAGLDVFEDEPRVRQDLIDFEHIVLLPHVGSASEYTRNAMGQLVADNLAAWAAGKGPLTPVVETPWPRR